MPEQPITYQRQLNAAIGDAPDRWATCRRSFPSLDATLDDLRYHLNVQSFEGLKATARKYLDRCRVVDSTGNVVWQGVEEPTSAPPPALSMNPVAEAKTWKAMYERLLADYLRIEGELRSYRELHTVFNMQPKEEDTNA